MSQLNVATGLVTYTINGNCEISFNPADADFAGRVVGVFEKISDLCHKTKLDPEKSVPEFMAATTKLDTEIRQEIDTLFGEPICAKIFGRTNVISLAEGLPIWANFLMAVIDEMDRAITEEKKKASPRAKKYIEKYEKKYGKKKK